MQIKDLKSNPKNPRIIKDKEFQALKKSLAKFGDLSGFVYNRRTKQLISGHQRKKALEKGTIKIDEKYEKPTKAFTVAVGHVKIDGESFRYREVDAPEEWEAEALLAANKHGGSWDDDLLKIYFADNPSIDVEMAGFSIPELKDFGIAPVELPTIYMEGESDEEYVKNFPQTTEEIPVEKPDNSVKGDAFEDAEDGKMAVTSRRFMIIIDCESEDAKQSLRDLLRPQIEEAGAKIF